jgi:hypothetical protein
MNLAAQPVHPFKGEGFAHVILYCRRLPARRWRDLIIRLYPGHCTRSGNQYWISIELSLLTKSQLQADAAERGIIPDGEFADLVGQYVCRGIVVLNRGDSKRRELEALQTAIKATPNPPQATTVARKIYPHLFSRYYFLRQPPTKPLPPD